MSCSVHSYIVDMRSSMHLLRHLDATLPAAALAALSPACAQRLVQNRINQTCLSRSWCVLNFSTPANTGERRRDFGAGGAAPSAPAGASAHVAEAIPGANHMEVVPVKLSWQ